MKSPEFSEPSRGEVLLRADIASLLSALAFDERLHIQQCPYDFELPARYLLYGEVASPKPELYDLVTLDRTQGPNGLETTKLRVGDAAYCVYPDAVVEIRDKKRQLKRYRYDVEELPVTEEQLSELSFCIREAWPVVMSSQELESADPDSQDGNDNPNL